MEFPYEVMVEEGDEVAEEIVQGAGSRGAATHDDALCLRVPGKELRHVALTRPTATFGAVRTRHQVVLNILSKFTQYVEKCR